MNIHSCVLKYSTPIQEPAIARPNSPSNTPLARTASNTDVSALYNDIGAEDVDSDVCSSIDEEEEARYGVKSRSSSFTLPPTGEIDLLSRDEVMQDSNVIMFPSEETKYSIHITFRVAASCKIDFFESIESLTKRENFVTNCGVITPKGSPDDDSSLYTLVVPERKVQSSKWSRTRIDLKFTTSPPNSSVASPRNSQNVSVAYQTHFVYSIVSQSKSTSAMILDTISEKTKSLSRIFSFSKVK